MQFEKEKEMWNITLIQSLNHGQSQGGRAERPLAAPKALIVECPALAIVVAKFTWIITKNHDDLWAPPFVSLSDKALQPSLTDLAFYHLHLQPWTFQGAS